MTDRMSDQQFDRDICDFLAWQATDIAGAPTAVEMTARVASHAVTGVIGRRVAPQLVWAILAGLLIVAALGVAAAGAALLRPPTGPLDPAISHATNGWIAYSTSPPMRAETDWASGADIYLVREGVEPRLIADRGAAHVRNVCPTFSPDGRHLAYAVEASYGRQLVVLAVDVDGGINDTVRFLVPGSRWTACPIWSSDGTRIAFIDTTTGTVAVRAPDGSPPAGGPAGLPGDPSLGDFVTEREATDRFVSPDGDRTVRLGEDAIELTGHDRRVPHPLPYRVNAYDLGAWAPDGRQVLLMTDGGRTFSIVAVTLDAPYRETVVATGPLNGARSFPGWGGDVSWQPVFP